MHETQQVSWINGCWCVVVCLCVYASFLRSKKILTWYFVLLLLLLLPPPPTALRIGQEKDWRKQTPQRKEEQVLRFEIGVQHLCTCA